MGASCLEVGGGGRTYSFWSQLTKKKPQTFARSKSNSIRLKSNKHYRLVSGKRFNTKHFSFTLKSLLILSWNPMIPMIRWRRRRQLAPTDFYHKATTMATTNLQVVLRLLISIQLRLLCLYFVDKPAETLTLTLTLKSPLSFCVNQTTLVYNKCRCWCKQWTQWSVNTQAKWKSSFGDF